ncbi:FkbM family methyltransferase [Helicobacter sp. MIT 14-3879]|uniref:FkbM family methyltransferase n=1 Tax=Helicobacter sp. MIT 14-3879 TaxID=2040649 RepID=UPI000E1F8ED0|nr:FkbM family methyltransferase [Helicobacter sp. MIT 14-3879]RDU64789.1 hypothetical protein CQA44_03505 [Helicobacter sp. MIT 14-3879]
MNIQRTKMSIEKINFVREFLEPSSKRYIFGFNKYSKFIIKALYERNLKVDGIVDDFTKDSVYSYKDIQIPLIKTNEIKCYAKVVVVVLCQTNLALDKLLYLQKLKIIEFIDYFAFFRILKEEFNISLLEIEFDDLFVANKTNSKVSTWKDFREHFRANRYEYEDIYNKLIENRSRKEFEQIINFRLNSDFSFMRDFTFRPNEQYFEEFLGLEGVDIFFDIGSYDGENSLEFIKRAKNYKQIYFFEIQKNNFINTTKNLFNYPNIKGFNIGLGEGKDIIGVKSSKTASYLTKDSTDMVEVNSIDNLLNNKEIIINGGGQRDIKIMLKLDIESSEEWALMGARNFITKYKPIIAICVYHRFDDFIRIPKLLLEFNPKYRLYFRHYSSGVSESVMFFV